MKLYRLVGILTVLLQNDITTSLYLSKRFEVSRRTISRDIDMLCLAGIPVITHQGSGGGISIADSFKLEKGLLTMDDLSSITVALKSLASVTRDSTIEHILEKLSIYQTSPVDESIRLDLASHYKGSLSEKLELTKKCRARQTRN